MPDWAGSGFSILEVTVRFPFRSLLVLSAVSWCSCGDSSTTPPDDTTPCDGDYCPPTSSQTAAALDSLAEVLYVVTQLDLGHTGDLDQFSFQHSRDLLQAAYASNPRDQVAAFSLAIADIFVLEDNDSLRAAADRWDAWLQNYSIGDLFRYPGFRGAEVYLWRRGTIPMNLSRDWLRDLVAVPGVTPLAPFLNPEQGELPPTPSEHQHLLEKFVRPVLKESADLLDKVTAQNFKFTLTPRMQGEAPGEADPLEIDQTEVLALRAAVHGALAGVDIALSYKASPSPWTVSGFDAALSPGSTFGTLQPDASQRLGSALTEVRKAVDLFDDALVFLMNETDDQNDDVIKHRPDDVDDQDIADARKYAAYARGALIGPHPVTEDFGFGKATLRIDLSKFFTNPIPDLKAAVPEYRTFQGTLEWTAMTYDEWVMPNPSFNGILPDMGSDAALKANIDICGVYRDGAPEGATCPCCYYSGPTPPPFAIAEGTWQLTTSIHYTGGSCGSDPAPEVTTAALCDIVWPGIITENPGEILDCYVGFNYDHASFSCNARLTQGSCTYRVTYTGDIDTDGDTFTLMAYVQGFFESGSECAEYCSRNMEVTGLRLSSSPPCSGAPGGPAFTPEAIVRGLVAWGVTR